MPRIIQNHQIGARDSYDLAAAASHTKLTHEAPPAKYHGSARYSGGIN